MSNVLEEKDPTTPTEYAIDPRADVTVAMRRDWPYAVGSVVKAPRHTGFYYEATQAGETSKNPAKLSSTAGVTTSDGSVLWACRHPADANLPQISSYTWEVSGEDSTLLVASTRNEDGILYPTLIGGTDGLSYDLTAHITWSTGREQDITVVIPVAETENQ